MATKKKSFNEDIQIIFDPLYHTYDWEGTKFVSATTYIKRFYKPFDSDKISEVSGRAWGVDKYVLADMWKQSGIIAADLGTVIHKALEHYFKFQEIGKKVSDKKGLDYNYAIPKHPILKRIVEEFIEIDTSKGKVYTEALITSYKKQICGHVDYLEVVDEERKICRIKDYKVNIDSEIIDKYNKVLAPFDYLPANKLSKYQLQLSVYANMMQESGWTVEMLEVYVLEDQWRRYELPVLQII